MRQATQVECQLAQTAQQLDQQITNKFIGQIQQAGCELEDFAKANPAGFKELARRSNYTIPARRMLSIAGKSLCSINNE